MGRINRPLTNEAAKKLMALDVQDKEILTYEKLDEWYTAWGGQCYVSFSGGKDSTVLAPSGGAVPGKLQNADMAAEPGVCEHGAGISRDTEVRQ